MTRTLVGIGFSWIALWFGLAAAAFLHTLTHFFDLTFIRARARRQM